MTSYLPRLLDSELRDAIAVHPAVLLVGPRACGKSTTARRQCDDVLRLDVPAQATAALADPDAVLRGLDEPVLIDEWQIVPEILGAVKRAVDDDPRPGRFVLTGSSQADLSSAGWPATGRIVRLPMFPLVARERHGDPAGASLIDRLAAQGLDIFEPASRRATDWDVRSYLADALASGWPEALRLRGERARDRWLSGYVDHLVTRDAPAVGVARSPARLRKYLRALAANTAGSPTHKVLYDSAGIDSGTATAYDDLLDSLMVTQRVPAWAGTPTDRAVRLPKRYLLDPGLSGALLRVDVRGVLRDGDLLGRTLDTYVAAQLRAECTMSVIGAELFHLRDRNGRHEVDLLVETRDGRVIAIEVKATASPKQDDARHLRWCAERLGPAFLAGLVVHTGPRVIRWDARTAAVPIAHLW